MSDQSKGVRVRARVVAAVGAVVAAPLAILALGATAAGAVTVSNETEFRNAWGNAAETSIVLGADITLTCGGGGNALRNSAVPVVVDGGGTFSITQTCANSTNLGQAGAGQVTFRNVTISGGNRGVVSNAADVVLEHSTVTGIADSTVSAAYGVFSFGDITLDDSHVSDVTAAGDDAFGVISLSGGVSLVNGSTISEVHVTGNNGEAFGGGSGSGGAVTLDHATITDIGGGTVGAGGFVAGGPAVVTDSRIAGVAGGGAAGLLATKGLTFTRSTIDGVTGGGTAAVGISLQTTEAASVTSSTVTDVTSVDDFAAGIFTGGPLETTDVLIHQIASTNDVAAGILDAGTAVDVTVTATTVSDLTGMGAFGVSANDGVLTVSDSAIESVDATAGTIAFGLNGGSVVTVTGTEIADVESGQIAIGVTGDPSIALVRSTIRGVRAPDLAAGLNASENARVENSTITGVTGYAAVAFGALTVVYSDIVGNGSATTPALPNAAAARTVDLPGGATLTLPDLAGFGGVQAQALSFGQVRGDGGVTLFGTVLTSPIGVFGNCAETATVASAGYNFADDTSCTLTGTGDRQGAGLDPQLGALAFNGGPTQTMAITQSSPLFDAIPAAACQSGPAAGVTTDQRGVARPSYTGCDIGAFEIESPVPVNIAPRFTG